MFSNGFFFLFKFGIVWYRVNCLPNDKISDLSKLKASAEDKTDTTGEHKFVLGRVENIVVTSIFSFSLNVFERLLSQGHSKSGLCGKGLNCLDRVEKIVGKEENAGKQHFLLFP